MLQGSRFGLSKTPANVEGRDVRPLLEAEKQAWSDSVLIVILATGEQGAVSGALEVGVLELIQSPPPGFFTHAGPCWRPHYLIARRSLRLAQRIVVPSPSGAVRLAGRGALVGGLLDSSALKEAVGIYGGRPITVGVGYRFDPADVVVGMGHPSPAGSDHPKPA